MEPSTASNDSEVRRSADVKGKLVAHLTTAFTICSVYQVEGVDTYSVVFEHQWEPNIDDSAVRGAVAAITAAMAYSKELQEQSVYAAFIATIEDALTNEF